MRICLPDEPEVIGIATACQIDEDAVVGKLLRLWGWADQHTHDGNATGVTKSWIDRYLRCDGFAEAMQKVGWLVVTEQGITFPSFDRHNLETGKTRSLTAARVKRHKANAKGNANSVTSALPDALSTRTRTRTEENTHTEPQRRRVFVPPTVEEAEGYIREKGYTINAEEFVNYYGARGWKAGKTPITDWRKCLTTWAIRNRNEAPQHSAVTAYETPTREMTQDELDAALAAAGAR